MTKQVGYFGIAEVGDLHALVMNGLLVVIGLHVAAEISSNMSSRMAC